MLFKELESFIEEDIGYNDVSSSIVPDCRIYAEIKTNQDGIISGLAEATQIFEYFDVFVTTDFIDGLSIKKGDIIFSIEGGARQILKAERLSLNFLGKMSGIATLTRKYVEKANGVRIACTRKTTPGFRKFEKKAVISGGGDSHRFNLSDTIMIKDNHISILGLKKAINNAKKLSSFTQKIEVEVSDLDSALEAASMGVDIIMFDNMSVYDIEKSIKLLIEKGLRKGVILEASGGITLENVGGYAKTGVDVISIGSLIHSSPWLDMSLSISKIP